MNSTQALAKAKKLLGPKAAIEVRNSVPVGEERLAEIAKRRALTDRLRSLKEARDARLNAVLKADAEYQRLKAEVVAMEKARDNLHAEYHHRVRVLVNKGWCAEVVSEGDNFDEALDALARKQERT